MTPSGPELLALRDQFPSTQALADHLGWPRTTARDRLREARETVIQKPNEGMRILAIDIETRPNLGYVWGLWDQNIGLPQLVESKEMMCWAAKWVGQPGVEFRSTHHDGQRQMIERAWELLDDADAVMHYNGRKFDVPHLNREFLRLGLTPPAPFKQIDLMRVVKKEFAFPSNKLAYVSKQLDLEGKVEHEGFDLWIKCMAGDDDAWDRMRKYNEQDVVLLEEAYAKLRPWISSHPSHGAMTGQDVCPNCGSHNLQSRGLAYLRTGSYPRFICGGCGKWSRGSKRVNGTGIVEETR